MVMQTSQRGRSRIEELGYDLCVTDGGINTRKSLGFFFWPK